MRASSLSFLNTEPTVSACGVKNVFCVDFDSCDKSTQSITNYQNVLGIAHPLNRCIINEKTNTKINDNNTNNYLTDSLFTENKRCAIFMLIVDTMLCNNWEYLYDATFSRDTAFTFHWRISSYAFSTFYKRVNGMFDVVDFFVSSFKQVFFKSQIKHMTQCIKPQTYRLHCIVLAEKW